MSRPVIAVTGLAQHGKDTVANHLVAAHGFVRDAFADDLKVAALALDPIVQTNDGGHRRLAELVETMGWEVAKTHRDVRRLLQRLGSEAGWMLHNDLLWVDHVARRIAAAEEDDDRSGTVISDLRFPHEAAWLNSVRGFLIRVHRPGMEATSGEQAAHSSESWIDRLTPDAVIVNDSSLQALQDRVDEVVAPLLLS